MAVQKYAMPRPQAATATQMPSESTPAIRARAGMLRRARGLDRALGAEFVDRDVDSPSDDQRRLELKHRIEHDVARLGREQHRSR